MMPPAILLGGRKELEDWDKVVTVSVQEAFAEAGIVKDLNISAPEKQLQVIFAVNIWCDRSLVQLAKGVLILCN